MVAIYKVVVIPANFGIGMRNCKTPSAGVLAILRTQRPLEICVSAV